MLGVWQKWVQPKVCENAQNKLQLQETANIRCDREKLRESGGENEKFHTLVPITVRQRI